MERETREKRRKEKTDIILRERWRERNRDRERMRERQGKREGRRKHR